MTVETFAAKMKRFMNASRKKFDWLRFLNRIVAFATAATGYSTLLHLIPGKAGIVITTLLGLIAAQGPRILSAAGILRPVAPGELSLYQTLLQTIDGYVNARKDKKAQATTSALVPLLPYLAPLIAKELDKSRQMDAQALAAGIAAKAAEMQQEAPPAATVVGADGP